MAAVTAGSPWRLVALLTAIGCQDLQSGLTPEEEITIDRYLACIDCVVRLDSVRALAARKPEPTVDSLNSGLVNGPGARAVAEAESLLAIGYVRDSSWRVERGLSLLPLRQTYVTEARDRYVNGYRARGAIGMGYIHTPRAVAYLDSALTLPLAPSVLRAVKYARDSLPPQSPRSLLVPP